MLSSNSYTGDGATKAFEVGFEFMSETDLRVIVAGALKVRGTDYTVQDPTASGGKNATIQFTNAPANAAAIEFYRNTPIAVPAKNPVISHLLERVALYRHQEQQEAQTRRLDYVVSSADLAAHTTQNIVAPCDGYIETLETVVSETIGATGGNVSVSIDGVAVTGLTIAVANAAAVGKFQSDTPTTPHDASTQVKRGQTIQIVNTAFAGGGALRGYITIQPADLG